MAMKAARAMDAGQVIGVDVRPYRLQMAERVAGAETINADDEDAVERVRELTHGRGADVCIDAVGMEADRNLFDKIKNVLKLQSGSISVLELCVSAVRRGGRISVMGVYATNYGNFPLGQILDKGIQLRAGQAPVHVFIDELMQMVEDGKIRTDDIITHRLPLEEASQAYDMFNQKADDCVKVVLTP